jgi:hypothetical protein
LRCAKANAKSAACAKWLALHVVGLKRVRIGSEFSKLPGRVALFTAWRSFNRLIYGLMVSLTVSVNKLLFILSQELTVGILSDAL